MVTPTTTRFFVATLVIVIGGYDTVAIGCGAPDASVSQFMESLKDYPVPMFVAGFLACHFFGVTMFDTKVKNNPAVEAARSNQVPLLEKEKWLAES